MMSRYFASFFGPRVIGTTYGKGPYATWRLQTSLLGISMACAPHTYALYEGKKFAPPPKRVLAALQTLLSIIALMIQIFSILSCIFSLANKCT